MSSRTVLNESCPMFLFDGDQSVDDGLEKISRPEILSAFITANKIFSSEYVFEIFTSFGKTFHSEFDESLMKKIILNVIERKLDLRVETAQEMKSAYLTCIPFPDASNKKLLRAVISIQDKYVNGRVDGIVGARRQYLLVVKLIHELGHAFTPEMIISCPGYVPKKSLIQTPENIGTVWTTLGPESDFGSAVEEKILGGRLITANNSVKPFSAPLKLVKTAFATLPPGPGNHKEFSVSDVYIEEKLAELASWDPSTGMPMPSLLIPDSALTLLSGNFAADEETARKRIFPKKRKNANETAGAGHDQDFSPTVLTAEFEDLVDLHLAWTDEEVAVRRSGRCI